MTTTDIPPPEAPADPRTPQEWIRDLINEEVPDGDYRVSEVAMQVWERAINENPERLNAFLWDLARQMIGGELRGIQRSRRSTMYHRQRSWAFGNAAQQFVQTGDQTVFHPFEIRYAVAGNVQRKVGDMRGDDHRYLAEKRRQSSFRDSLMSQFHLRVADVVGDRRTAEAMSEEQYTRLYQALVGEPLAEDERMNPPTDV